MLPPFVLSHCTFMFTCTLPLSTAPDSLLSNSSRSSGHFLRCRSGISYVFDLLNLDSIETPSSIFAPISSSVAQLELEDVAECSSCTVGHRKSVFASRECRCVGTVRWTFSNVADVASASQKMQQGWCALQATTPSFETIVSTVRFGSGRCSWTVFCVHSGRFPRISTPSFFSHQAILPFHIPSSPWFRRVPACVATFVSPSIPRTWLATPIHVTRWIHLFRTHRSGSILDLLDIHFPFKTGFHGIIGRCT